MKKLLIAIGCLTAVVLTSSCTADNIESSNNETLKTKNQVIEPGNQSAVNDTNPNISSDEPIDDVNPPRPR